MSKVQDMAFGFMIAATLVCVAVAFAFHAEMIDAKKDAGKHEAARKACELNLKKTKAGIFDTDVCKEIRRVGFFNRSHICIDLENRSAAEISGTFQHELAHLYFAEDQAHFENHSQAAWIKTKYGG